MESIYSIMSKINDFIYSFGKPTGLITGLIFVVSGIILAFMGYRLKKFTLILMGFLIGVTAGIYICEIIQIDNILIIIAFSVLLGLLASFLNFFLYFLAIIIIGVLMGGGLGYIIGNILEISHSIQIALAVILAILGGFLSIKINKLMFIICTAYYGYILFRMGLFSIDIFQLNKTTQEIVSLIFFLSGLIYQLIDNFKPKSEARAEVEE